jgi:hypothetical protein
MATTRHTELPEPDDVETLGAMGAALEPVAPPAFWPPAPSPLAGATDVADDGVVAPPVPPGVDVGGGVVLGGGNVTVAAIAGLGRTGGSFGRSLPPMRALDVAGVGSNRWVHPRPASHTSGHACASCDPTV